MATLFHSLILRKHDTSATFLILYLLCDAVAMAGKNCVAIGSDLRLGVQLQTQATDFKKVYKIHDRLFLGLSGLATDAETL